MEKRFKKKDKKDHDSWNDILVDWYEENKQDPWPKVVSALESYDGSVDDIVKEIKRINFSCVITLTSNGIKIVIRFFKII